MYKEKFFKQLKDELHGHPFRGRFLEELQDHAEDLVSNEKIKNDSIQSEIIKKYLGAPKEIKSNFMKTMHPFANILFYLEGICYGLLLMPINMFFFLIVASSGSIDSLFISIYRAIVLIGTLFLLYFICFKRFLNIKPTVNKGPFWWTVLISLPSFIWLIASIIGLFYRPTILMPNLAPGYIVYLILSVGLLYTSWRTANRFSDDKILNKNKSLFIIRIVAFSYFISFLIFRTANSYIDLMIYQGDSVSFLAEIFSPLLMLEDLFSFLSNVTLSLFDYISGGSNSIFINVYFPALILGFISIYSLWIVTKHKKVIFLRLGIFSYVLSLFFINTEAYTERITFQVDALPLSSIIEKNELKFLYGPTKFFNEEEGRLFNYAVDFKNGEFEVQNNIGKSFYVNPEKFNANFNHQNFDSLISKIVASNYNNNLKGVLNPEIGVNEIIWPTDFICENEALQIEEPIIETKAKSEMVNINNSPTCLRLLYKGEVVLEEIRGIFTDVDFSDDKKWMAFVFTKSFQDPEEVYLVKLKK